VEEAVDWYRENNKPGTLLAVKAVERVRSINSQVLRSWANAVMRGDDPSTVEDVERKEQFSLSEICTDLSRRRFSGGDVKIRTQIAIAAWMSRDQPSVFLNYMSYYVSKTSIGIEKIGQDRPIVYTKRGEDTLWMVRLIVLINGWWLERGKIFKDQQDVLHSCILFIAQDPFVNSAFLKKLIAPYMQVISLHCFGDSYSWDDGVAKHYVRDAFSFDKAVVSAWKFKLDDSRSKLEASGLQPVSVFLDKVVYSSCSLDDAYVASVLKYISNVVGYGRTPLALAIDDQLNSAAEMYRPEGIPAAETIADVAYDVTLRAITRPSGGFHTPIARNAFHKVVIPSIMTSNSSGGLRVRLDGMVRGERKIINSAAKNQVLLNDPNRVMWTKLSLSERLPEDVSDIEALRRWFNRVKLSGDDYLSDGPWIIGIRQVPGNKPERMILMVPVEMMAYEGALIYLIYRYGLKTSYFTVSQQTGRVFSNDHVISLATGNSTVHGMYVIVSTDFSFFDLTERDTHWTPVTSGVVRAIRHEGIARVNVMGKPLEELVTIPQRAYSTAQFGEQSRTVGEDGRVRGEGMIISSGGVLSGEFGTMPKNCIIHEGIRRWIYANMKDFDPAPLYKIILDFGFDLKFGEIVELLGFWYVLFQETKTNVDKDDAVAHHGVMGDDGITRAKIPDLDFTSSHYLVLAAALEYGMSINGLSMNATKMTLSSSMCEYLKVLFIRGAVHPNILQVLPQRERSSMATDARLMTKSVADYAALACSRGLDSTFANDYFGLVVGLKWIVKTGYDKVTKKSIYEELPLRGLVNPDIGPGVVLGYLHLGAMPDVCRWAFSGTRTVGVSTKLDSDAIVESLVPNFKKGENFLRGNLDRERVTESLNAAERLGGPTDGLGYYDTPRRSVKRAAKAGKTEELAWKASKAELKEGDVEGLVFDIKFEGEVEARMAVKDVPIGGVSDDIRKMLAQVGVGGTVYGRELGIVKLLRSRDPGFLGDQDEDRVARLFAKSPADRYVDIMLYLGVSRSVAGEIDIDEIADCLLPEGMDTRIISSYYGFIDFSNPNLRRFVTFIQDGLSPVMTRWALLTGLSFFMTQRGTFRRVVISYPMDVFGYFH
jgi:hypothetical protein